MSSQAKAKDLLGILENNLKRSFDLAQDDRKYKIPQKKLRRVHRTFKIIGRLKLDGKKSFLFGLNHILLLMFSILFSTIAIGINSVSLPYVLYQNQVTNSLIGFSTASDFVGGIIMIFFLNKLTNKIGLFNSILFLSFIGSFVILFLPYYQNFILWFVLCFALGSSVISVTTLRRAWLNIIISNKVRAMVTAVSSAVLCAGFTIGPVIVKLCGAGDYKVFIISSIFTILSAFILLPIRKSEPKLVTPTKLKISALIKRNSKIMTIRFLTDLQCGTIMFFTVIYGLNSGLSAENAGLLISVFSVVGVLDFLIGFIVNQRSYQKLILFGFILIFFGIIALPFAIKNYYLAILIYVILGWVTSLIAICCWYGTNLKKHKSQMVFINSTFMAIGLFGIFIGNLLVGIAMQYFGKEGFVVVIAAASVFYLLFTTSKNLKSANLKN